MAKNVLLKALVDGVLGDGVQTSGENYAYHCPRCNHKKRKLEVNFEDHPKGLNLFACWTCGDFKGRTVMALLKALGAPLSSIEKARSYVKYVDFEPGNEQAVDVKLPKEFIQLSDPNIKKDWIWERAMKYLTSRGITNGDIHKYNIGYCRSKEYRNMVVFPLYNSKGILNYFVARSFDEKSWMKYKNPKLSKDIVPNEHLINWDVPVILCEGIFDAIAIKRNALPILGKNIQKSVMRKLLSSNAGKIYLMLDKDAQDQAYNYCELFLDQGKEVYLVDVDRKDPSEMGFVKCIESLQNTLPVDYNGLLEHKLGL